MKYKIEITYFDEEYKQTFYVVVDHQEGWKEKPEVKITKLEAEG